ncbi:hypothetical protein [Agarivorans gilvus]|uniref:Uncharacterized protein n=1 Tax=Agarivorans gilvus TaxID=680279 RepID=A0ABQ1I2P7_9ALTE|nr:hypothetical protein [Agarivorans gilvus]GGB10549.1 hypothetical protein GCM10007414_24900 [Agarivorans gilvus]
MVFDLRLRESKVFGEIFNLTTGTITPESASQYLTKFLADLDDSSKQDESKANEIFNLIISELERLSSDDGRFLICLYSIHVKYGDKVAAVKEIEKYIVSSDVDFNSAWFIYWQVLREVFVNRQLFDYSEVGACLISMYKKVFNLFDKSISPLFEKTLSINSISGVSGCNKERERKKIVIVTNQFLGLKHAPTILAVRMAKKYNELGFDVSIINTACLPRKYSVFYVGSTTFNYVPEYSRVGIDISLFSEGNIEISKAGGRENNVIHDGVKIPFCQVDSLHEYSVALSSILDNEVDLVISVSDSNLFCDYLSKHAGSSIPIIMHPTSSGLPLVIYSNPLLLNHPVECEKNRSVDDLILERYYPKRFNYLPLARRDFSLPENNFLIAIVGNRLEEEIDNNFVELLERIISSTPSVSIVFVGCDESILNNFDLPLRRASFVIPYQQDLASFLKIMDLYLNPDRTGSGTSAVMALGASVPVATLAKRYSDVSWWVQDEFSFSDYNSMLDFIFKCIFDKEFFQQQKNKAISIYDDVTLSGNSFEKILWDCGLC